MQQRLGSGHDVGRELGDQKIGHVFARCRHRPIALILSQETLASASCESPCDRHL